MKKVQILQHPANLTPFVSRWSIPFIKGMMDQYIVTAVYTDNGSDDDICARAISITNKKHISVQKSSHLVNSRKLGADDIIVIDDNYYLVRNGFVLM